MCLGIEYPNEDYNNCQKVKDDSKSKTSNGFNFEPNKEHGKTCKNNFSLAQIENQAIWDVHFPQENGLGRS